MIRLCKKCKKPMKQQTRGFNMTWVCTCGETLGPVSITNVGIRKGHLNIICAASKKGRSVFK